MVHYTIAVKELERRAAWKRGGGGGGRAGRRSSTCAAQSAPRWPASQKVTTVHMHRERASPHFAPPTSAREIAWLATVARLACMVRE